MVRSSRELACCVFGKRCHLTPRSCTRRAVKFRGGKKIPDPARAGDEEVDLFCAPSQTFLGVPTGLGAGTGGAGAGGAGGASSMAGAGAGMAGAGAGIDGASGVVDIILAGADWV
jgi:hypothetical protein